MRIRYLRRPPRLRTREEHLDLDELLAGTRTVTGRQPWGMSWTRSRRVNRSQRR